MKSVYMFLLLGAVMCSISASSLVEQALPFLDAVEKLPILLQRSRAEVPLRDILGQPKAVELDVLETQIRSQLGKKIREEYEGILKTLDGRVDNVGEKLNDLKTVLKGQPSKENAESFIYEINRLIDSRDFVDRAMTSSFEGTALAAVTWNAIESRNIKDWWNKVKNWFKGLGSKISDKFKEFKNWAKKVFEKAIDAAKPLLNQIKQLAIEFLKQNWDKLTVALVRQALSFFNPYLGQLGGELTEKLIELARKFNLIPWEKMAFLFGL